MNHPGRATDGLPQGAPARLAWRGLATLPAAAAAGFVLLFLVYPLARILTVGLAPVSAGGLPALLTLVQKTGLADLIAFSAGQALASTLLTLAAGLPAAYVFARYDFPGKTVLRALLTVPFVMPTVVTAAGFYALLGPGGVADGLVDAAFGPASGGLNLMYTLPLVILAHAFYNVSVVIRIVGGFWANLDPRLREAAATLGASPAKGLLFVTLPVLMPAILAASLLVFAFCFTSFGVVLILGGPRMATMEVEIYRQALYLLDLPAAALLSLVQLALTAAVMAVYSRAQARSSRRLNLRPARATQRRPGRVSEWLVVIGLAGGTTAALALPLLVLAIRSFTARSGPSTVFWTSLFQDIRGSIFYAPPPLAVRNSLAFATVAVALSLIVGTGAAYAIARRDRRGDRGRSVTVDLLEALFMLPLGASAVTLGLGFIIALGEPPLDLRASPILIPIAHAMVALPLVARSLLPALRSINPAWREAAATLGATPFAVWREVDLPILSRAVLVAAAFAFTVSLGEFGATSLLTRPDLPTLPIVIYNFLGQPGEMNQGQALAMSTLLMVVCAAGLMAIERFRLPNATEF